MKARNVLPIIVIAIASAGGYLSTSKQAPQPERVAAIEAHHPSPAVVALHGDHDAIAVHDMTLHAMRHFVNATAQPESLRTWQDWTPEWELRLLSFDRDGHIEHVYHATNKRQPENRFTITADSALSDTWLRAN